MFYYVLWCLASRATIGIGDRADANRLRDRDNLTGIGDNSAEIGDNSAEIGDNSAEIGDNSAEIGDNSAEIGDDAAGIVDIAANVIPSQTPSWVETGVTLFLEDKFQRGLELGSPWEVQQFLQNIYKISGVWKMAVDLVRSIVDGKVGVIGDAAPVMESGGSRKACINICNLQVWKKYPYLHD